MNREDVLNFCSGETFKKLNWRSCSEKNKTSKNLRNKPIKPNKS